MKVEDLGRPTAKSLKAWIKALRSGRYKQASGALHNRGAKGNTYCCLGVYARVMGCSIAQIKAYQSNTKEEVLPRSVLYHPDQCKLVAMNDGDTDASFPYWKQPATFREIADFIERRLLPKYTKKTTKKKSKKAKK